MMVLTPRYVTYVLEKSVDGVVCGNSKKRKVTKKQEGSKSSPCALASACRTNQLMIDEFTEGHLRSLENSPIGDWFIWLCVSLTVVTVKLTGCSCVSRWD